MGLKEYRKKRDFGKTSEPRGGKKARRKADSEGGAREPGPIFVVQKHDASHLHYDFRLEMGGTLKSWAVPKGPSLDPSQKRLAVRTEDHPLEYADFEGVIPEGEYGGGTVMAWDSGAVRYDEDGAETARCVEERKPFAFELEGQKLRGRWRLVPFRTRDGKDRNWLLIKSKDASADTGGDVLKAHPESAKTGRTLEQIAEAGEVWSDRAVPYGD